MSADRQMQPGEVILVRVRTSYGHRTRTVVGCQFCGEAFLRFDGPLYHCGDFCRLADKILIQDDGCWIWQAQVDRHGYGRFRLNGRSTSAHRASMKLHGVSVPDAKDIDHLCRNRACCNPAHLEVVTHRENVLRGLAPSAVSAQMNRCAQGHEFTPENTYVWPRSNKRRCRTCQRAYQQLHSTRIREAS